MLIILCSKHANLFIYNFRNCNILLKKRGKMNNLSMLLQGYLATDNVTTSNKQEREKNRKKIFQDLIKQSHIADGPSAWRPAKISKPQVVSTKMNEQRNNYCSFSLNFGQNAGEHSRKIQGISKPLWCRTSVKSLTVPKKQRKEKPTIILTPMLYYKMLRQLI